MSTRRPRFKPVAILKSRRPAVQSTENIKSEPEILAVVPDEQNEVVDAAEPSSLTSSLSDRPPFAIDDEALKITPPESKPNVDAASATTTNTMRASSRRIRPNVCLPASRSRKIVPKSVTTESEPATIDHDLNQPATPKLEEPPSEKLVPPIVVDDNKNNEQVSTPPQTHNFKSPFMSPSIQSSRSSEFPHNPLLLDDLNAADDSVRCPPMSPTKVVRQRIRPTPCFGNRRNSSSQGGYISESDDETLSTSYRPFVSYASASTAGVGGTTTTTTNNNNSATSTVSIVQVSSSGRQRYLSTSSSYSNHGGGGGSVMATNKPVDRLSRYRTESVCSNVSEMTSSAVAKVKKSNRSEEFKRFMNAKKDFHQRFRGKTPDKARLTMYDLIHYNPLTNPMKNPAQKPATIKERRGSSSSGMSVVSKVPSIASSKASSRAASILSVKKELKLEEESLDSHHNSVMPVPQLKLGPNGEIMLDEKSLVIETTGDKEARETLANADIVYDDEFSGTSGFYKRSARCRNWSQEETVRFYRCLHTIGTDFSLMLSLFPYRNRRELKFKFKKEEKLNGHLINKALQFPKEFDIDELQAEFEKEDAEIEKKLREDEAIQEETKEKLSKQHRKRASRKASLTARTLSDGENIYKLEFARPSKRKRTSKEKNAQLSSPPSPSTPPQPNVNSIVTINFNATNSDNTKENEMILSEQLNVVKPLTPVSQPQSPAGSKHLNNSDILTMEVVFEDSNLANLTVPTNITTGSIITLPSDLEQVVSVDSGTQNQLADMDIDEECSGLLTNPIINYKLEKQTMVQCENDEIETYEEQIEMGMYDDVAVDSIKTRCDDDGADVNVDRPIKQLNEIPYKYLTGEKDEDNSTEEAEEEVVDEDCNGDTLEVVARQDPYDATKLIYEVYQVCGRTGKKGDEPLDLPPDVIERIKSELQNS